MKDEHAASKKPESERPPRGLPLWKLLVLLVLVAAGVGIGIWVAPWMRPATKAQVTEAVDQVNRALSQKLIGQATHDDVVKALNRLAPKPKTKGTQWYQAPMMPWIISQHLGKSPMGMDMVPIDPAKFTGEIAINPVVVQDIGVRIAPVTQGPLVKTIRTVGTVDYDEPLVRDVNLKVGGWIEKLYVNYLGQHVKRGEPLFSLYSPDLYAAQEEYLLAWKNRRKVGAPFVPEAAANARDLVKAARTKLEYYDITDAQIAALQKSGRVAKTMTMRSPYDGVVTAKHANEGMHVKPGMQVFRIADLSKVWVMVTLYEYQLPYVEVGQEAVMTLPYVPGQTFKGKVIYIYPYLNDKTRQVQVRLQFDNPTGLLKPGMYANIELHSELAAKRTLVPRSAVIDTGTRQLAFVSLGGGKFEPRNVKLGVESDSTSGSDLVEVLSGLKPGEMVVVNGQFLLDSEANTREALAKMMKGDLAANQKAVAKVTGTSELSTLPPALATQLNRLLTAYLHIQGALYNDKLTGIAVEGKAIASAADAMTDIAIAGQPHFWHEHQEIATIGGKGTELTKATDLKTARADFADLSTALGTLLKATGVPPNFGKPLQKLHCPMYRANQGGNIWMQTGSAVHDSLGQMVASILSKKLAAGSTHLIVDIPVGPTAKVRHTREALRLRKLFEYVGDRIGIHIEVVITDGRQPVGRGIGPALEARDVMQVLQNDPAAPTDLREKALRLAGRVIEFDPDVRGGQGYAIARDILDSGRAMLRMNEVIDDQGRREPEPVGALSFDVQSDKKGVVTEIDNLLLARIARLAGAPMDKGAGVDLFKKLGDPVEPGEVLYRVYAEFPPDLRFAREQCDSSNGYRIGVADDIPAYSFGL